MSTRHEVDDGAERAHGVSFSTPYSTPPLDSPYDEMLNPRLACHVEEALAFIHLDDGQALLVE